MSTQMPIIKESNRFNFFTSIWIVPFVALVIAGWLAFQYFSQLGPKIEITFESNKGLKAGQSQIKYRDVTIGVIEKVVLHSNGTSVRVIARMDKAATPYLNDDAKFWIVKPEVGIGGISGLDTIISGTYINMKSDKKSMNKKKFVGLEESLKDSEDGIRIRLNATNAYNVVKGTPLFFKSMYAGDIEEIDISADGKSVDMILYIKKDFVTYVHEDSKFWVQSALNVGYQNGKVDFTVAPLRNLLRGGIEFSSSGQDSARKLPNDFVFRLYQNSSIADSKKIGRKGEKELKDYILYFDETMSKLNNDASVVYQGYDIGRVKDIILSYNKKTHIIAGKVLITIDSAIFYDDNNTGDENLKLAVKEGLRASLQKRDPITGLQYIELVFSDENETREIIKTEKYAIFPTLKQGEDGLMSGLTGIIAAIEKLPLEKLVISMDNAINSVTGMLEGNKEATKHLLVTVDKTLNSVNTLVKSKAFNEIPVEINETLVALQQSLKSLDSVIKGNSSESLLSSQMTQTLKEVSQTSRDTQKLLKKLERKPNSLLFGD